MTDLVEWAAERPLFTVNEAQRASEMNRASLREKLSRLARRGDLHRIERGKYTVHDDPTIYATYVETPSYLSLWSGLRYYDLTTQQPTKIQVIAATNRTDLPDVEFYTASEMFGFGRERYAGFAVFVAHEERLLIDCLARPQVPVSELDGLVRAVDPERVTDYANRFGRKAVTKRVGYLIERIQGVTVDELRVQDRNYPVLDLARPANGDTDPTWRLRVNADVE